VTLAGAKKAPPGPLLLTAAQDKGNAYHHRYDDERSDSRQAKSRGATLKSFSF
jgi:hypothetical protein